ncbi:putative acetyltransferase [compost metagenome]|nr:N-acetyltransferase [Pseudomonas sp. MYb187]
MDIRSTQTKDWLLLKQVRLAALLDAPTAFGVRYQTAASNSDEQWQERASPGGTEFWLAFEGNKPVGMIGAAVSGTNRFNLTGMWVEPAARGSGAATQLIEAVKSRALERGYEQVVLDVSPENKSASSLYLKQGFSFMDEWEPLESHPHIILQTMVWTPGGWFMTPAACECFRGRKQPASLVKPTKGDE